MTRTSVTPFRVVRVNEHDYTVHEDVHAEIERLHAHMRILTEEGRRQMDALRVENERTQEWLDRFQGEVAQRDIALLELRAENQRQAEQIAALRAEIERLRHIHCECEYSEPCPNETENERLRELLKRAAGYLPEGSAIKKNVEQGLAAS